MTDLHGAMDRFARLIETHPIPIGSETEVQLALGNLFSREAVTHEREVLLSEGNRIDFLVDPDLTPNSGWWISAAPLPIGIEVKIRGDRRQMLRQLQRYADHDAIEALMLVTATATGMPSEINSKPVRVVSLGAAWL